MLERNIRWSETNSIPPINADSLYIVRALRNLVDNALKYGGDTLSRITFDCRVSPESYILCVSDDGAGIEQDGNDLFNAFVRSTSSEGVQGAGLGLAIVREIAEKHGGRVWIEPAKEKGITFCLSISKQLRPGR